MDRSQRRRGGGIRGAASGPMGRRQRRYTHRHRKRYGQSALATETAALPSLPSMKHVPSTKDLLGGASSLPFEAGSLPNAGRTNQKGHAMPSGVLHVVGSRWCARSSQSGWSDRAPPPIVVEGPRGRAGRRSGAASGAHPATTLSWKAQRTRGVPCNRRTRPAVCFHP